MSDKNAVGLPLLPTDYMGPCRFAVDDLGWLSGMVTAYSAGQFGVLDLVTGETRWIDREVVLRPGEELRHAVLRRGKLEVKCELVLEEYGTRAGKRAAVVLRVTANGEDCGKTSVASGPARDVKELFDGEIDLAELNRRWRGIH